jgi:hypothetical protein
MGKDIPPVDDGPGDLAGVLALQEERLVLRVGKLEGLDMGQYGVVGAYD